jgi:hypothetical protein
MILSDGILSCQILLSIPEDRIQRMQRRLGRVWHRFAYTRGKVIRSTFEQFHRENLQGSVQEDSSEQPLKRVRRYPHDDDAFGTIMQWLYSRIPWARELRSSQSAKANNLASYVWG